MVESRELLSQIYVQIDGADAPDEFTQSLHKVVVESSLHLPDVASIVLHDTGLEWVDDARLSPGTEIRVSADSGDGDSALFEGEIVEIEPEFAPGAMSLVVHAFDRLHRLSRGRHVRSFQNVTHGDLVQTIAREVGLQAEVAETAIVHDYVLQHNETNLEFLSRRSAHLGYLLFVRNTTLHCEPPGTNDSPVDLEWGAGLGEFRPRMTTVGQVDTVTVRGWDPATRTEILGSAGEPAGIPEIGESATGGEKARTAFDLPATRTVSDIPIRSQAEADLLAQAVANQLAGDFIQADGIAGGNPAIVAGANVNVTAVGDRFSGRYFVTSARHIYSPENGYSTEFSVSGHEPQTLINLLSHPPALQTQPHLLIGIVTDNQDPENLARVKVRFPSLSDDHASNWARVVAPGAGSDRGIQFLPEINDEVLVGFELGDVHHPYVIGGLWNGQDAPPIPGGDAVSSGRVEKRVIVSRTGHTISLDDSDSGGVTVVDRNGNRVHLDSSANSLTIEVQGNVGIQASGNLTLESGARMELKGNAGISVDSPGPVEITGAVVKLN